MGEGPKDLKNDAGRFDAPRNDDMMGRGDADAIGRGVTGTEPLPTAGAYPSGATSARPRDEAADETSEETSDIRAEIEQKRADISETIDEITARLAPGNLMSQATGSVKESARDAVRRATDTASETARRVADRTSDTARRVTDRASETARRVADRATDTARRAANTAGETASQVADSTRRMSRTAVYQVREHPWSAGAVLVGLGAAVLWMMSRRSSGAEEWDVDDYSEESLYYEDDEVVVDRGNRFVNVMRDNPVPLALTTIGLGWWLWNQRAGRRVSYESGYPASTVESTWDERSEYGADAGGYRSFDSERGVWVGGEDRTDTTTDRVKQTVSDATDRARATLSNATDRAREKMGDVAGRTRVVAGRAQRQVGQYARQASSQLEYWMERNPLAVGAVAMAIGAAVGMALPETRREQELMGDARDRVVDNARTMANQAVDRAKNAAENLVGTARNAADTSSSTAGAARDVIDRASQAAKDTINKIE
jgi:ElaB/YqjD/DUF883 family membrane-anchored ribosome-binding protein